MTTPPDPRLVVREPRRCIILERMGGAWCAVHDTAPDWHSDVPGWNDRAGWVCPDREVDDVILEAGAAPFFATLAAAAHSVGGLEYRGGSLWHAVLVAVRPVDRYETTEEWIASARGAAATLRSHILAVCLFCTALAGALPVEARRLIAAYCAGDADALLALADLVEERGLTGPLAQWAEERQGWLEATGHEHVWLPWVSGDGDRAIWASRGPSNLDGVRRCTCGVFEHEADRPRRDDLIGDIPDRLCLQIARRSRY